MTRRTINLDRIAVRTPCTSAWKEMNGNDQVRFCDQCGKHVYDFSQLTRKEIETLIIQYKGQLCARFFRRDDGTIVTAAEPVGLRALPRRVSRIAATIFTAIIGFGTSVAAQTIRHAETLHPPRSSQVESKQNQSKFPNVPPSLTTFSGTIFDIQLAVIPGAQITLTNEGAQQVLGVRQVFKIESNEEGVFEFSDIPAGTYTLKIEAANFTQYLRQHFRLSFGQQQHLDVTLHASVMDEITGFIITEEAIP